MVQGTAFYSPDACFAVALLLHIAVWTEDQDFFGSGVSTWTTDHVEVYLRGPAEE